MRLQELMLEEQDLCEQNYKTSLPYALYKNQLKMDQRVKSLLDTKLLEEYIKGTLQFIEVGKEFLEKVPQAQ